jgi:glycosyltransferase involved in cell wall biosynthesis
MTQKQISDHSPADGDVGIQQSRHFGPLLSVLVATRNRQPYAFALIKDILSWADERVEVVISDNSEEAILSGWLAELMPDSRIKYQYSPRQMSAIDNFNRVVDAASGNFVCLIGDDDGLHPASIDAIAWADNLSIDCLMGSVEHEYIWPRRNNPALADVLKSDGHNGILTMPSFTGRMRTQRGPLDLRGLLNRGCTQYHDLAYPRLYHGFVRRSVLEKMRHSGGPVLGGLSPDIYAAVFLSQLTGLTVSLDYPLTIPGVSPASGTAIEGKSKEYSLNIREAPHFRAREWYTFNAKLPPFYCVDSIWADSACLALENMTLGDLCSDLKIFRLSAYIIRHQPLLREPLLRWLVEQGHARTRVGALGLTALAYIGPPFASDLRRVARKILRTVGLGGGKLLKDLPTITDARLTITAHVSRLPVPWSSSNEFTSTRAGS